jgi:hypothetical protein
MTGKRAIMSMLIALAAGVADLPRVEAMPSVLRYPHANELLDRDATLKAWAVRIYDSNRDGWLTLYEAQPAMAAFKDIADSDGDDRITTAEYRRAVEFITARWAAQ